MKRGFLLAEETLKIIVAVIAISFLVYFLVSLYSANQDSNNLEFAKPVLNELVAAMNEGQESYDVSNDIPGWSITIWPLAYEEEIFSPLTCSNLAWKRCVCVCKEPLVMKYISGYSDKCDGSTTGYCLELTSEFRVDDEDKTPNNLDLQKIPFSIEIDQGDKTILGVKK